MGGDPNKQLMLLRCEMERIRSKLHKALDAAGGKHLDESVQEILPPIRQSVLHLHAANGRPPEGGTFPFRRPGDLIHTMLPGLHERSPTARR